MAALAAGLLAAIRLLAVLAAGLLTSWAAGSRALLPPFLPLPRAPSRRRSGEGGGGVRDGRPAGWSAPPPANTAAEAAAARGAPGGGRPRCRSDPGRRQRAAARRSFSERGRRKTHFPLRVFLFSPPLPLPFSVRPSPSHTHPFSHPTFFPSGGGAGTLRRVLLASLHPPAAPLFSSTYT